MSKRSDPEALGDTEAEEKKELGLMELAMDMVEKDVQDFRKIRHKFYTDIVYSIRTIRNGNLKKGDYIYWINPTEEELSIFSKLTRRVVTCQTIYGKIYIRIGHTLQEEEEEERRKKKLKIEELEETLAKLKESLTRNSSTINT